MALSDPSSFHHRVRAASLCLVAPVVAYGLMAFAHDLLPGLPFMAELWAPLLSPAGVIAGCAVQRRWRDGLKQVVRTYYYAMMGWLGLTLLFRPEGDREVVLAVLMGFLGGQLIGMIQAARQVYRAAR